MCPGLSLHTLLENIHVLVNARLKLQSDCLKIHDFCHTFELLFQWMFVLSIAVFLVLYLQALLAFV